MLPVIEPFVIGLEEDGAIWRAQERERAYWRRHPRTAEPPQPQVNLRPRTLKVDADPAFTAAVVAERALVAWQDPVGEAQAVAPLGEFEAFRAIHDYVEKSRRREVLPAGNLVQARRDFHNDRLLGVLGVPPGRSAAVVRCPAHEDVHPSLSVRIAGERVLLHCFGGCTFAEILAAVAA